MKENFDRIIPWVHQDEGEFSNDPHDTGGPTRLGITIHDYRKWTGNKNATALDVKNMSEAMVRDIYKEWYWDAVNGDELPSGVDYFMFDSGLLSGTVTASRWLQRCVGVKPDGIIGPRTLEAIRKDEPLQVLLKVEKLRRQSLRSLKQWSRYGRGWTNRVNKSKARALKLIDNNND